MLHLFSRYCLVGRMWVEILLNIGNDVMHNLGCLGVAEYRLQEIHLLI